ncbi:MAG: PEP-CTERM sorting domain-containing protein [Planctomycetota bacterium]
MTRFLALGVVLALGIPGVASAELLFNPGFEDVDTNGSQGDGWGSFGAAGFNAFFGANGHASLFMDNDGNGGGIFQTGIAGTAGTEYQFELTDVLIESNAEADVQFGLEYFDITDSTKPGEMLVTLDLDNPNFIMTGTAVSGTEFVRPIIIFNNSVGTPDGSENVFIFDASLTEVPEPGSLLLLGAGATLLLRRRSVA